MLPVEKCNEGQSSNLQRMGQEVIAGLYNVLMLGCNVVVARCRNALYLMMRTL